MLLRHRRELYLRCTSQTQAMLCLQVYSRLRLYGVAVLDGVCLIQNDPIPHALVAKQCELVPRLASEARFVLFALVEHRLALRVPLLEFGG